MGVALSTPKAIPASWFGGTGSISGTVTDRDGAPAVRTILVYDSFSRRLIRTTTSSADGAYAVTSLAIGLVVDVVFLDDEAAPILEHIIASRVVVA